MNKTAVQEKRQQHLAALRVSSDALIEKWGADLVRYQSMIARGEKLRPEDNRRYQFLRAFLVVSIDRKEDRPCSN